MSEGWASNLSLEKKVVDVQVKAWDVRTGELFHGHIVLKDLVLKANRSTDFPDFKIPSITGAETRSVVARVYLLERGVVVASHINFHEPLKEVPFQQANNLA
jgi:beta-mannosidase